MKATVRSRSPASLEERWWTRKSSRRASGGAALWKTEVCVQRVIHCRRELEEQKAKEAYFQKTLEGKTVVL